MPRSYRHIKQYETEMLMDTETLTDSESVSILCLLLSKKADKGKLAFVCSSFVFILGYPNI